MSGWRGERLRNEQEREALAAACACDATVNAATMNLWGRAA